MINKEKLNGCTDKILNLADWLEGFGITEKLGELIITSGKRSVEDNAKIPNASKTSLHTSGNAMDFTYKDTNIFKVVTPLFWYFLGNQGVFEGCTQFEVCRDANGTQHIHLGFGKESVKISFTGTYK